jgi:hypothetical protein
MDVAQGSPFGTAVLSDKTLSAFEERASVLYVGGSVGEQLTLLRTQV